MSANSCDILYKEKAEKANTESPPKQTSSRKRGLFCWMGKGESYTRRCMEEYEPRGAIIWTSLTENGQRDGTKCRFCGGVMPSRNG